MAGKIGGKGGAGTSWRARGRHFSKYPPVRRTHTRACFHTSMVSALIKAVKAGNFYPVMECIDRGDDLNARGDSVSTALAWSIRRDGRRSFYRVFRLLLDHGADPNARDHDGRTAIFWAIKKEVPDMFNDLLREGANPNVYDKSGNTPLSLAVCMDHGAMVSILLHWGAVVDDKAITWARMNPDGRNHVASTVRRARGNLRKMRVRFWATRLLFWWASRAWAPGTRTHEVMCHTYENMDSPE